MKTPSFSRRAWLKLFSGGAGAALIGGSLAWHQQDRIKRLQDGEVESYLRENFHYLKLEISSDGFAKFHEDYKKHYQLVPRKLWYLARGGDARSYSKELDQLATIFLLSTDFFLNGADEGMAVKYVTLYSPYAAPCFNPVALGALQRAQ